MSDTSSRPVGGPPKRAGKAPASSLIKRNRPQPSFPPAAETEAPAVVAEQPPAAPTPVPSSADPITPAAFLERPTTSPSAPAFVVPAGEEQVAASAADRPTVASAPAEPTAPAESAPPAAQTASSAEQDDALVNTTFRLRRSVKHAFNAAFLSAKLHEGWPSAEAYFQDMIERETKRIQDAYNNGQPFPIRDKALPRGRPLGS